MTLRTGNLAQEAPQPANVEDLGEFNPAKSINHAGFSLFVLDQWGEIAPDQRKYYDFTVRTLMNEDTFISIYANGLQDSAGSYFMLKYNPEDWRVREVLPGDYYGTDKSLFISVQEIAGTLPIGIARVRPQDNGLISGDGLLAEVAFMPGPAPGSKTTSSTAIQSSLIITNYDVISLGMAAELVWDDQLRGDYDNSGKVTVADLTPLAMFFGGKVGDGLGNDAAEGFVDAGANNDSVLSIADITPIAMNFGRTIEGYNIYRSVQGHAEIPEKKLANLLVPASDFSIDRIVNEPYQPAPYIYEDDTLVDDFISPSTTFIYRIVPCGDSGEADFDVSDTVDIAETADTTPPHGPGAPTNPYLGLVSVDAGNGRAKITYRRNAVDNVTPAENLRYFLYLGPTGPDYGIDLANSAIVEVTAIAPPYIWEGLANGTTYAVYIAAEDEAGNRTSPVAGAVKTVTPSAGARNDFDPPVWDTTVGVTTATAGDSGIRVTFGTATDAQSPPVRYRVYYAADTELLFESSPYYETDSSPFSITGLQNNMTYTVGVRAIDSADRYDPPISPNEDPNTVTITLTPSAGAGDITPPVWDTTTGVANVVPGEGSLRVEFGTATDAQSPPVTYTIYYQQGTKVDFTAATQSLDVATNFPPTFIIGLLNAQEYTVLIRAKDAVGNQEKNNVAISATPNVGLDNLPPVWDTTVGVQSTSFGNGFMDLSWNSATDAQSPPVGYRVYWEVGTNGITDYAQAIADGRSATTTNLYYRVEGLSNSTDYSFAVRAYDSWTPPNEDYNLVYLVDSPRPGVSYNTTLVLDDPVLNVQYTSLDVAPDGTIGVAYTLANEFEAGKFKYELRYAESTNGGQSFTDELVIGDHLNLSCGKMASLKFDPSGTAHIAYVNNTHEYDVDPQIPRTQIEYITRIGPGTWAPPDIVDDSGDDTVLINPSLAFDSAGNPGISYVAWLTATAAKINGLFYAYGGGPWTVEQVNNVHAGNGPSQDGSNCSLAFGTFAIGADPAKEMPTIAFSDPSKSGQLCWTLRRGADDWVTLGLDDTSWMTYVSMTMWKTKYLGNDIWLPRIAYRMETGSALFIAKSYVDSGMLTWSFTMADFESNPGTGYYNDIAVAFEAGYEMIFATTYSMALERGHLCIENLLSGDYLVYDVDPVVGGGKYINMGLLRVGANDKACISQVVDGNLYVAVMR